MQGRDLLVFLVGHVHIQPDTIVACDVKRAPERQERSRELAFGVLRAVGVENLLW